MRTTLAMIAAAGLLVIAACSSEEVAPVSGGSITSSTTSAAPTSKPSDSPSPTTAAAAAVPPGYREVTVDRAVMAVPKAWQDVDVDLASEDLEKIDMPDAMRQQLQIADASGLRPIMIFDPSSRTADNAGFATNVTVLRRSIAPRLGGNEADLVAAAEAATRAEGYPDAQAEVAQVNGQDALRMQGSAPVHGITLFVDQYVLPHDGSSHIVTLTTDSPDRYREQFETMLRSFRVSD